jgi:DNA-3-methyladenine glycosylase II
VKKREGVIAGTDKKAIKPPKPESVSNAKPVSNKSRVAKASAKPVKTARRKKAAAKAGARK